MSPRIAFLATLLLPAAATPGLAQIVLQAAPSTRATAEVALTPATAQPGAFAPARVIRLDYGQPHLRGRSLHTDSLVPYDQSWRLGANNATTIRTDVDLTLGTADLAAGTYVLEAIPTRATWLLVIHRISGTNAEGENILAEVSRVPLRRRELHQPMESLTMWLIPSREPGPARGELRFAWGMSELSTDWLVR